LIRALGDTELQFKELLRGFCWGIHWGAM
jgi:hypothetical protein